MSDPYYPGERELRNDAHKWETALNKSKRFRGTSLKNPVFDVHYHARAAGAATSSAPPIRYALVVSVNAPRSGDLYNQVVQRYQTVLEQLRPVVDIPIRVGT